MRFQVGDTVKCVKIESPIQLIKKGNIYTIANIKKGNYLEFEEIKQNHNYSGNDRFELVSRKSMLPEELFTL